MKLRIHEVIPESVVDGPGLRLSVFTQGCPHACPGCHNPATHDPNGGYDVEVEALAKMLADDPLLSGVTLTGGEPFFQPLGCLSLALSAHAQSKSVWAYTGYTLEKLREKSDREINALLGQIDVLVDGPFLLPERSLELKFRGSKNQRLIDMAKTGSGEIVLWQDPWEF
ncbi:MAG: anaerobic ribonucleoside-triphosphate reductase activating protein [Bacillota bacterium]